VGRSRRDAAQRLRAVLSSSDAPLLGVVANGSKSGDASAYAYTRDVTAPSEGATARDNASVSSASDELVPTAEA
jgi:hypothetical protein